MTGSPGSDRFLLRHALATIAYRGAKTTRGVTRSFASFRLTESSRTPVEILAHIGDLLEWAHSLVKGEQRWNVADPLEWNEEVARFHRLLSELDARLASDAEVCAPLEALFQGPVADALTHVGQLAMLRRLAGEPMKGENYFKADVAVGRVGSEQMPPRREF